jgi:hypothetical protein
MKAFVIALLAGSAFATAAAAQDYAQYPAPSLQDPLPQSYLTGAYAIVPPYGPLPIRVYTTPPNGPYYNVPPYRVIAPY